jgi:transposase InsO family protein
MKQIARNVTMGEEGFLNGCKYLLHDRDGKFCAGFDGVLEAAGLTALKLPPRSPNLNAHLERWNRSIKEECLSKLILFGERSLHYVLKKFGTHFHTERNHQGRGNVILFPAPTDRVGEADGAIEMRERLGGLLKFYHRKAP